MSTPPHLNPVLTSVRLTLTMSPAVAASLPLREETLTGWPDPARWQALDGDLDDTAYQALIPPTAQHVASLADGLLLLAWSRHCGLIASLVRDHSAPLDQHAYAVIIAP